MKRKDTRLEKAILKEMREHPWASRAQARRIAQDHRMKRR